MSTLAISSDDITPDWYQSVSAELSNIISDFDLTETSAWADLDALSTRTVLEEFVVSDDVLIEEGDYFVAPATVFVTLNYGDGSDSFSINESFFSRVMFNVVGGDEDTEVKIKILNIYVDTSSFYR